jgi:hypothetical protein
VPAIIRVGDDSMMKLEIAIIENLQREDLNPVERARAFARLVEEFKFTHTQIGQKMGKSREYVSNSLRLLALPQEFLDALSAGKINEGHTRPLMMLSSRPEEQMTLFKEIVFRKISVREAERIARRIAVDKVRKKELLPNTELMEIEQKLQESLGTRVHIEPREVGGKITIDYFSPADLDTIMNVLGNQEHAHRGPLETLKELFSKKDSEAQQAAQKEIQKDEPKPTESTTENADAQEARQEAKEEVDLLEDRSREEVTQTEEDVDDLYNVKNFSL